ncbi:MAG TPA: GNAT family N-acetyltransferase [Rhodothermales bacterium]|nr:GNAT family N-acetyltransferase [Rhodothermales bacterium]
MSLDRIRDVAALHRMAFSGYLNTKLGLPYLRAFLRWFCEGEEAIALCALRAGEPVGYVVGAPLGYTQALNRSVFVPALAGILLRPWLIFDGHFRQTVAGRWQAWRGRDPLDDAPDLPMPTFSLVGIAVHPAARGKRIGQQLIDAFEAQARAAGACALRLSVYSDNKAAQRLYTRAGWSHHPRGGAHADYYYKLLEKDSTVASAFPGASVHFTGKDGR